MASSSSAAGGGEEEELHGADPALLSQLLEMGVNRNLGIRALLLSDNCSVEAAFTWLGELSHEEQEALASKPVEDDAAEWEDIEEYGEDGASQDIAAASLSHKMVLVVDSSLRMKPGKVAAQVGHAVLGLYRRLRRQTTRHRCSLTKWELCGEKMVVVKAINGAQMNELKQQAEQLRLLSYTVSDAGLTQIEPGSQTVLAIFGRGLDVDKVTGSLKLL